MRCWFKPRFSRQVFGELKAAFAGKPAPTGIASYTNFVARELAPARLRSRREIFSVMEILGPLRDPAGASSLATKAIAFHVLTQKTFRRD